MTTLVIIGILILIGVAAGFLMVFVLNIGGIPGELISGKPGIRSKGQFIFAAVIAAIGQSYLALSFTAFIISWCLFRMKDGNAIRFLVWVIAFLVCVYPIYSSLIAARVEDKEKSCSMAQVEAIHITIILVSIGFFVFLFVPNSMNTLWKWVPYVN